MAALRGHVLLFDRGHVPELESVRRFCEPRSGIDLDEGIAGYEAVERGHLAIHGADGVLGGLEAKVLAQVSLSVCLDLVLHQVDALELKRLKLLSEHAV